MSFSSGLTGMAGGFQMSLIALGTVFIVIAFLAIMIMLLHKVCYKPQRCEETAEVTESKTAADCAECDTELFAVITAAVMQYTNGDAKVVSFRPSAVCAPQKSAWRNFGRIQNFERNI